MEGHNLVAVYNSREEAERVRDRLIEFGIPAGDIRLSPTDAGGGVVGSVSNDANAMPHQRHGSFWDWLLGSDVPEHDRNWYGTNLREGRTALSVLIRRDAEHERVVDILEEFNPVHMDEDATAGVAGSTPGSSAISSGVTQAGRTELTQEGEQVIPVVKEELAVGKRATERRYRIRAYVVETPIEEQVTLRDERVIVERRPASGEVANGADALREREFEVTERHEEPVVEKRAHQVEEVVVHREANQRVETVRDTVRETKVDVDKDDTAGRVGTAGGASLNRKP